ncbi:MAG: dynamin family protein [Sphingobacteriaceae bacterium]|nr:dynamin family protein [Sphingobacteriaceae bacterium]
MKNNIFEIIVTSTMSSGKSTLLNAVIGKELLPSKNEACTARVCRIEDDDSKQGFFIRKKMSNGNTLLEKCTPEKIDEMNSITDENYIDIVGEIPSIINMDKRLVIYDTPGPNNSCDDSHRDVTKSILHDGNYGLILYVINATQVGINDDQQLLIEIKSVINQSTEHKDVLFVVNKIDEIDDEKECSSSLMKNIQTYLENNGFKNPIILPVSAYYALLARKIMQGDKLTRREEISLFYQLQHFENNPVAFLKLAHVPITIRKYSKEQVKSLNESSPNKHYQINKLSVSDNRLNAFIHYTGLGLLEHIIQKLLTDTATLDGALISLANIFGTYFDVQNEIKLRDSKISATQKISFINRMFKGKGALRKIHRRANRRR